jgi:hypothetical protein
VAVEGQRITIHGYVYIDREGLITAYAARKAGESECYVVASGTAANAALQGRMLRPGASPAGDRAFVTKSGDVTFGVLTERTSSGDLKWFVHNASRNNTANVTGLLDVVNVGDKSFAISGAALSSPTLGELQSRLCSD